MKTILILALVTSALALLTFGFLLFTAYKPLVNYTINHPFLTGLLVCAALMVVGTTIDLLKQKQ